MPIDPLTEAELENLAVKTARFAAITGDVSFGAEADRFVLTAASPDGGEQLSLLRDLAQAAGRLVAELRRARATPPA